MRGFFIFCIYIDENDSRTQIVSILQTMSKICRQLHKKVLASLPYFHYNFKNSVEKGSLIYL